MGLRICKEGATAKNPAQWLVVCLPSLVCTKVMNNVKLLKGKKSSTGLPFFISTTQPKILHAKQQSNQALAQCAQKLQAHLHQDARVDVKF